ncbi:MAG: cupin domain-containing protein [Thermoanaerobaculia bacterium]
MRNFTFLFLILLLPLVVLAHSSSSEAPADPAEVRMENLFQQALAEDFTPGREVVVSHVEIPPHTTLQRHWHPGEEFIYLRDGEVEITIDGQSAMLDTPGEVAHVPFRKLHTAITHDRGARVVVFRVHTTGEPVRYFEKGGSADQ